MSSASTIRVLHVVPASFGPDGTIGGAERYALGLAQAMSRRTPTRLVSFGSSEKRWRVGDLPIRVLPRTHYVRGIRSNPLSTELVREVLQADVVHCHQQHVLASSLSAILGRAIGRTVVVTDHGGGGCDFSWYVSTDRLFQRHLHVSAFSLASANQTRDTSASVISCGVDIDVFAPPPTRAVRTGRVLFVGRVLPHKALHDVIDALPGGVGLDVVGPELDDRYSDELRRRAVDRDVAFVGAVSEPELVQRYRHALCVVLPSVTRNEFGADTTVPELLGQTLLEGMACGTPAIATNVGGMPETIVDGVTGFIVPPADPEALRSCLERLAEDPSLVERLGDEAQRHVRRSFVWDLVVGRCLSLYDSAANLRPPT
jgi:glycosyltransferase involved in cell wall biosynthesis